MGQRKEKVLFSSAISYWNVLVEIRVGIGLLCRMGCRFKALLWRISSASRDFSSCLKRAHASRILQLSASHQIPPSTSEHGYAEGMVHQFSWRRRESLVKQYSRLFH